MIVKPNLNSLLSMFFRRLKLFCIVALIVVIGGGGYLVLATPKYRSEASVVVRFDTNSVPQTDLAKDSTATVTAQGDRHETVLAHADILNSPDLARAVIDQVGLAEAYPDIVSDPPRRGTPMDEAIYDFGKNLIVDPEQQGDVISIQFTHPNPVMAQTILKDLINGYMEREAAIFSQPHIDFENAQVKDAAARLEIAQSDLRDYKAKGGITSFDEQMTALIKARSDTYGSLQAAQVALVDATQRRDELQRLIKNVPASLVNSASGEKYHSADDAQSTLDALQLKERQLRATYQAGSPVLDQLRAQISSASADLRTRQAEIGRRDSTAPNLVFQNIQTDLLRATAEALGDTNTVDVLTNQVATLDRQLDRMEQLHSGLIERTRTVELADNTFRSLSLHLEDARVADGRLKDRISHGAIVSQPSLPYKPAKPRYVIMALAFLVASLIAGAGAVLTAEVLDDRFTSPNQIGDALGIPVLAVFDEA